MANKETFLLVSLNESKAKKLAEVISNNTCRNILDFLAKGEATESEIAKELSIPISTVHYNLTHLVDAKLVKADTYHYSPKGKEVLHYKLANQYVIIAPESAKESIKEKLKSIIPAAAITLGVGAIAQFLYKMRFDTAVNFAQEKMMEAAPAVAGEGERMLMTASADMAEEAAIAAPQAAEETTRQYLISDVNVLVWFIAGAFLFLASYLFIEYIRRKLKQRKDEKE
ncbi:MAG: helix-turn-helix domain-containing protein [Nanoarchaeota archaeon]|nr:helix-turn-helix domain-containing protein [Nanoarchaeota archaeon]